MTRRNDWPRDERPRERLLACGAQSLSDGELLAVLLGPGVGDLGALERARGLLDRFGGLDGLLAAGAGELAQARGLGPVGIARLKAAAELGKRLIERPLEPRAKLSSPRDAADCFRARLADLPHEAFSCLFLDTRHRIICFETLFRGTIDGATVYPREVLKRALHHNAAAIILGHNHPSGVCEPSEADRGITEKLARALSLVDVRLLDHLIVSRAGHLSLAERGWI